MARRLILDEKGPDVFVTPARRLCLRRPRLRHPSHRENLAVAFQGAAGFFIWGEDVRGGDARGEHTRGASPAANAARAANGAVVQNR